MDAQKEKEIINAWAKKAMILMAKHKVQPMPENYSVWFEYVRGGNKQLSDTINKRIESGTEFDRDTVREYYNNYILKEMNNKAVEDASSQVQQIMNSVLRTIETSSSDTDSYNEDLDSFATSLKEDSSDNIEDFVNKIMQKTEGLKVKGDQLSKKLQDSQSQVESLQANLEEVSKQVSMDALTGIPNRKAFDDTILDLTREAKDTGKDLCLLMVDVDHFKNFNDTHGHLLGDQVLKIVASTMREAIKGKDFVARYGGEEFAILLPETPTHGGQIVAESVRKSIASRELKRKDTGESYGKLTVSIGMSTFKRFDQINDFIERADKALYKSKDNGRNMVSLES